MDYLQLDESEKIDFLTTLKGNLLPEKFSDNLVRKIRQASNNGKDEKAISIINQIFLDD